MPGKPGGNTNIGNLNKLERPADTDADGPVLDVGVVPHHDGVRSGIMSLEQFKAVGGETVHLSRRQKWELLELAAAGVMSTVFFAAPVLLLRDAPQTTLSPTEAQQTLLQPPAARVQIAMAEVTVPVSTPLLRPAGPRARSGDLQRRRIRETPRATLVASARPRVPVVRRIARLFAGDGSYRVQPFPTIARR